MSVKEWSSYAVRRLYNFSGRKLRTVRFDILRNCWIIDFQLWSGYIELGVALVTSSALQPERWSGRGPDRPRMRAAAGLQVLAVWSRLGKPPPVFRDELLLSYFSIQAAFMF